MPDVPAPDVPAPDAPHPPARWSLPDRPDLDRLRRRAKQLRRAVDQRDPRALALVESYDPPLDARPFPLARAQRVLARAFGFAGWSRLRDHLAVLESYARPMDGRAEDDDPVDAFLRLACLSYTEPASAERAAAVLRERPQLALASAATMASTGRADELAQLLRGDPAAVRTEGGPHRWPPLLYLAYSRLGLAEPQLAGDPVATLRVLLDAGADPDSGFLWRGLPSPFTALTGVLGGGERDEPAHPDAVALAELLLTAGADPNDNQALYNRAFRPDDSHLPPLLAHGLGRPRPSPWRDRLGTAYPSPAEMVGEHLRAAAEAGFTDRVRLLLEHGVDPDTTGYHPVHGDQTAYELAVRNGNTPAAELLAAAGASAERLDEVDLLLSSALAGDTATTRRLATPGLAAEARERRSEAMRVAAEHGSSTALGLLLELGYAVDAAGRDGATALHQAALAGDATLCHWLLEHGADRVLTDRRFGSTPAGWAHHAGHVDLAAELEQPV